MPTDTPSGNCGASTVGEIQALSQIWSAKELSKATKVKIYETLVLSVLLYNSETWTLKEEQIRRLMVFDMSCLRKLVLL